MNARLEVIRFRNEDLIATSALPVPDVFCEAYGAVHFYTDETIVSYDEIKDETVATGKVYRYNGPGNLELFARGNMVIPGKVDILENTFYHADAGVGHSVICEIQRHYK